MNKVLLTFSFCLFTLSLIKAQWSNDPSVNLQVSSWGVNPIAASDGNGGAFIGWAGLNAQWELDVYLQHVDKYGYVKWAQPIIIGGYGDNQGDADIVEDSGGVALLSFIDATAVDTIGSTVIYKSKALVQKIDSMGNKLWGEGVRVSLDTTDQAYARIISDGQGGAIVAWKERDDYFADTTRLFIQKITSNGQSTWGDTGILVLNDIGNGDPLLVPDNAGGAILFYWDGNTRYFQRIDSNGNSAWTTISPIGYVQMISDRAGGALMAGERYLGGTQLQIVSNRISNIGVLEWGNEGIVVEDSVGIYSQVTDIEVRTDSISSIYWTKVHDPVSDFDVFTQMISDSGGLLFSDGSIPISTISSLKGGKAVELSNNNSVIYTWSDYRNSDHELYAQKLDSEGNRLWDSTDVLITNRENQSCLLISDMNDGIIMIWDGGGIFAQQVNKDGVLGQVITSIDYPHNHLPMVKKFKLYQNYPNPFNSFTVIPYTIANFGKVTIIIYNLTGQKIKEFLRVHSQAGSYKIIWDGRNQQGRSVCSGIYMYRLKTSKGYKTRKLIYLK